MRFLVMGAGAIGSVFGGFLAKAGHQVSLVGRQGHMKAIKEKGLRIKGLWGEHLISNLATYTGVDQVLRQAFDYVLIATKAYDTEKATREALSLVGKDTVVASLQNGLGNYEAIAGLVGEERTILARLLFGAEVVEDGVVEVTVHGGEVLLGSPEKRFPRRRVEELAQAFSQAGVKAQVTSEITAYIWGKLLYNCCLNPLCALLGVPYGALLKTQETVTLMDAIIREAFAVAEELSLPLLWKAPEEYRDLLFQELIPSTAAHYGSMYTDVIRGRRTEIDALNGAIVNLGQGVAIPTPVNRFLTMLIKAREGLARQVAELP